MWEFQLKLWEDVGRPRRIELTRKMKHEQLILQEEILQQILRSQGGKKVGPPWREVAGFFGKTKNR